VKLIFSRLALFRKRKALTGDRDREWAQRAKESDGMIKKLVV